MNAVPNLPARRARLRLRVLIAMALLTLILAGAAYFKALSIERVEAVLPSESAAPP